MDTFTKIIDDLSKNDDAIWKSGKNSRSDIYEYGYHFDSKEELDVYEWIDEAKRIGFVENFIYQPPSFTLFDGRKNDKNKFIVRPHIYTADFKLIMTDKWLNFRKNNKIKIFDKFDEKEIYIDVKGTWSRFSDGRDFQINFKWMLDKFNIYVWKVIPIKFFEKTWLPEKCVVTRKTKKISSKYKNLKTFEHHNFSI